MKILLPIAFISSSILIFFIFINPLRNDVASLRSDVALYSTAFNNSINLQKTQDSLIDSYKNIKQEDKDKLEHFLPSTVNNIKFILEIERIANLNGMPVKNIIFQGQSEDTINKDPNKNIQVVENIEDRLPYGVFPVEFMTDGSYTKFISFLKDLENNLRLVDVKSVSFNVPASGEKSPSGGTVNPNIFTYSLKVETYWLK